MKMKMNGIGMQRGITRGRLGVRREHRDSMRDSAVPSSSYTSSCAVAVHAVVPEMESSSSSSARESEDRSRSIRNSFESVFSVRSFDVGPDKGATLPCIANMLQETGVEQLVSHHGRGGRFYATDPEMDRRNLIFVLSRLRLDMRKYPAWGARVAVRTWFAQSGRAAWRRDWLVRDADTGEQLGAASSIWLTVNTETRRPGKVDGSLRDKYEQLTNSDAWALGEGETAGKVPEMQSKSDVGDADADAESGDDGAYELRVPFGTLDMNGHVNNVQYMTWILDSVPAAVRESCSCTSITVEYRSESEVGSNVCCTTRTMQGDDEAASSTACDTDGNANDTHELLHTVRTAGNTSARNEVARAISTWISYPIEP